MLSTRDIADMRTDAAEAMPETAVLQRVVRTADGQGGYTQAWTAAGTVSCRRAPHTQRIESIGARFAADSDWVIVLPAGTGARAGDRLTISGTTYSAQGVEAPRSVQIVERVGASVVP